MKPNYKSLAAHGLKELIDMTPDMSFGEVLYSVLRKQNLSSRPSLENTYWLTQISDEDFFHATERAIKDELAE